MEKRSEMAKATMKKEKKAFSMLVNAHPLELLLTYLHIFNFRKKSSGKVLFWQNQ